jgi:hypothetical protein
MVGECEDGRAAIGAVGVWRKIREFRSLSDRPGFHARVEKWEALGMRAVACAAISAFVLAVADPISAAGQESSSQEAQTQDTAVATTSQSPWSFGVTSYLWLAGLSGDVGAQGQVADIDVSFGEIFDSLDWLPPPVMVAGEIRYGRFAVLSDFIYLGLEGDGASPGPLPLSAELDLNTVIWTFAGSYRVIQNDPVTLDLLAGGRLWNLDAELTIAAPGAALQRSGSETWVDPIIGVAGRVKLGSNFALQAEGDVGGFGVNADIDWQVLGTLQYLLNDSISLEAGYRYLAVDYDDGGFLFDVALHGPIIGGSFHF